MTNPHENSHYTILVGGRAVHVDRSSTGSLAMSCGAAKAMADAGEIGVKHQVMRGDECVAAYQKDKRGKVVSWVR